MQLVAALRRGRLGGGRRGRLNGEQPLGRVRRHLGGGDVGRFDDVFAARTAVSGGGREKGNCGGRMAVSNLNSLKGISCIAVGASIRQGSYRDASMLTSVCGGFAGSDAATS